MNMSDYVQTRKILKTIPKQKKKQLTYEYSKPILHQIMDKITIINQL